MKIMTYEIFDDSLANEKLISGKKKIVNTLNAHSYIIAKNDKIFDEALRSSDVLLPDGSGIVLAAKTIYGKTIKKIAGHDLHQYLLSELDKIGGSVFYMGASQDTLDKIHERITREHPSVKVGSHSPPFKPEFTPDENAEIIEKINAFSPDVLFVGMTAPKQEKWLHVHKDKLNFRTGACIGAVFDFYAGTVIRPSQFWINVHLEWLPRLIKEPRRLWKRNFVSTPLFLADMIIYRMKVRS